MITNVNCKMAFWYVIWKIIIVVPSKARTSFDDLLEGRGLSLFVRFPHRHFIDTEVKCMAKRCGEIVVGGLVGNVEKVVKERWEDEKVFKEEYMDIRGERTKTCEV